MAQVNVTINGRVYRMACDDGQEDHLIGLGRQLSEAIEGLRSSFGEVGDQRLTVMAAITLADELSEARRRIGALEEDVGRLAAEAAAAREAAQAAEDRMAGALDAASERLEAAAGRLATGGRGAPPS
jgi:cell division protein ZapA